MLHLDEEMGFIQSNNTRHRVPEIYPSSNLMQKCRHNNNNRSQGQKKRRLMWMKLQMIVKKMNKTAMYKTCHYFHVTKRITNPPQLVFLTSMIGICQGCRRRYTAKDRKKPNHFVFKYLMYRDQYGTKERNHYRSAGYFHAYDLGCMRRYDKLENAQMDEIYISNATFHTFTPDHIKKLRMNNMWDAIIRNQQRLM